VNVESIDLFCVCVGVSVSNEKVITIVFNMCLLDSDTACFIVY